MIGKATWKTGWTQRVVANGHGVPMGALQAEHNRYLCCSVSLSLMWRRQDKVAPDAKLGQAVDSTQVQDHLKSQATHSGTSWQNETIHSKQEMFQLNRKKSFFTIRQTSRVTGYPRGCTVSVPWCLQDPIC